MDTKVGLALFCSLFFFGCSRDRGGCKDPMPTGNIAIRDTSGHWFEKLLTDQTVPVSSDKGRSESIDISCYRSFKSKPPLDCILYYYENRLVTYRSSIYERHYECTVAREYDEDVLSITANDYEEKCELNLQHPVSCIVTYKSPQDNFTKLQITLPVVIIDSLPMHDYLFRRTYRIDFQKSSYSPDGETRVIYLNPVYGIVKFETFDGETWSLY